MTLGNMRIVRWFAAICAAAITTGCASSIDDDILSPYAEPGRYDFLDCPTISKTLAKVSYTEKQLAQLFDAFLVFHNRPDKAMFNVYSNSTDYIPTITGQGKYRLSYRVQSEKFPPTRGAFLLTLASNLAQVILEPLN